MRGCLNKQKSTQDWMSFIWMCSLILKDHNEDQEGKYHIHPQKSIRQRTQQSRLVDLASVSLGDHQTNPSEKCFIRYDG